MRKQALILAYFISKMAFIVFEKTRDEFRMKPSEEAEQ
jgi:hypothetical protein